MHVKGTHIAATECEVFTLWASRLIVTAVDPFWRDAAVQAATGYGSSIIGCDCEAGLEQPLTADQTPDGRPGAALLFFHRRVEKLAQAVQNRAGQCLMTTPTTAVFDGLPTVADPSQRLGLGGWLRFFGDGHQRQTEHAGRTGWAIPVMDGDFFAEATVGCDQAVGGAAVFVQGADPASTLTAARQGVEAIASQPGIITPFPGGVCRSGSKVGSRYRKLIASTNDAYCPTLRHASGLSSQLPDSVNCVYEVVIDGLTSEAVQQAVGTLVHHAAGEEVFQISTGVHGGKLTGQRWALRSMVQSAGGAVG
jgi:formylmethanofuran--tetrahydromethanopterin N-formyltransferase